MGRNNINLADNWDLSEIEKINKPWIAEIKIDLQKRLITIDRIPDKEGDVEVFCLEPSPTNEEHCSLSSGYRGKKGEYFSEGRIAKIPVSFNQILFSIQPLIACLPINCLS